MKFIFLSILVILNFCDCKIRIRKGAKLRDALDAKGNFNAFQRIKQTVDGPKRLESKCKINISIIFKKYFFFFYNKEELLEENQQTLDNFHIMR